MYIRPFETPVWIFTTLAVVLIIAILHFILTSESRILRLRHSDEAAVDSTWSFLVLYAVGEICQQGFSYIPHLASGKMVVLTTLIFSFMIYQFYSASVVSFTLMVRPPTINTMQDLLASQLGAGCDDNLIDRDYFNQTTNPLARALFEAKMRHANASGFYGTEEGLRMVAGGSFAFHVQRSEAYPVIEKTFSDKALCDLHEVEMYPTQYVYTALQKRSPFRKMINHCLARQMETGVVRRQRDHWNKPRPECINSAYAVNIQLSLDQCVWTLGLLLTGMALSVAVLGIELVAQQSLVRRCKMPKRLRRLRFT